MNKTVYSFDEFDFGPKLIRDLVNQKKETNEFVTDFYTTQNISKARLTKVFSEQNRQLLVDVLTEQNQTIQLSSPSLANIQSLKQKNTFTITTGHQLNLLTGPLFSIFKIAQIISICDGLKKSDPTSNYVPVFWMATEDHDFEEINHLHLFGKKIAWQNPEQKDVVAGRMKLAQLASVLDEIEALYQNEELKSQVKKITNIYRESINLADATRKLINHLFGEFGLVILDGNDEKLKQNFKSVLLKEVRDEIAFKAVSETNLKLKASGYQEQVFVRNCNLFFIHADGKRERIVKENNSFLFNDKSHSLAEVEKLIEADTCFSPNALLRPVYQESVLPNLVYVGGAGEISYWLQLKDLFDQLNLSFPLLRVRDSVAILNQKQISELEELNLTLPDLKESVESITKKLTMLKSGADLNLEDAKADIRSIKNQVLSKSIRIDKNLSSMVEAEFVKMIASVEKIEEKLIKTEKSKDELSGKRILKLQEKIFPENHLQERHDNFLPFYLATPNFISTIITEMKFESNPHIRIVNL